MNREYWANLILGVFLAVLAMYAVAKMGSVLTPKGLFVGEPEISQEAARFLNDVRLTQFSIVRENRKVTADFYVRNNAAADVKNLEILCEFYDENGSYLKREKWILYHTFPAGTEEKFTSVTERFVNVRGPVECLITDLQPVGDPGFDPHQQAGAGHGNAYGDDAGHNMPSGSSH
ncbi:MAG: hypothetical protein SCH71_05195 [Desulfobulbaceae bacterium]|nr:hypothetical protein [Desulfobulbaceae bacterium]